MGLSIGNQFTSTKGTSIGGGLSSGDGFSFSGFGGPKLNLCWGNETFLIWGFDTFLVWG